MENTNTPRIPSETTLQPSQPLKSTRYHTFSKNQFPVDEKALKNRSSHHSHSASSAPLNPLSSSMTSFPAKSSQTPSASSLNVNYSKKELTKIPRVILDYVSSLQTLDLSKNQFTEFPEEILKLLQLKTLKFEANYLKRIPAEIHQLSQLENISFASNYIISVPKTIGRLAKTLQTLNLAHNHIEQLPKEITELSNLKVLSIQNNFFVGLPVQMDSLVSLKELGLEWFKYTSPPLKVVQSDKSRSTILKLFQLCKTLISFGKPEITFEDFINHFSLLDENIFSMKDSLRRNLLHIATLEQEIGIVRYIAEHREDLLDELDQDGQTPLSLAVREEKYFVARLLLSHGADPKIGGGAFGSALHMVTSRHQLGMIRELLKHGASPNSKDMEGNTPLHLLFSIFSKNLEVSKEIAQLFMNFGADLNQFNNDLWTPLHLAIRRGQVECVQWIVESNQREKGREDKIFDVNCEGGSDKWTPLHLASGQSHYEIANILLENGAEVMTRTKTGKTAKDVAVNCPIVIKILNKMERKWVHKHLLKPEKGSVPLSGYEGLRDITSTVAVDNRCSVDSAPTEEKQEGMKRKTVRNVEQRSSMTSSVSIKRQLKIETQLSERREYKEEKEGKEVKTGRYDNGDVEDSIMIGDIDEISEPKETTRVMPKSPNNIQKLQIAQNYRNHIFNLITSPKGSVIGTIDPENKDATKSTTIESARGTVTQRQQKIDMIQKFSFPNEFSKYIRKFEHFTDEIKVFQNTILNGNYPDTPTCDKLKLLFYMRAIHLKLTKKIYSLNSDLIPFELFIIFESIDDENKKNAYGLPNSKIPHNNQDLILRSLHFILENLEAKDFSQTVLIKAKICQLFGEFKHTPARPFLQQVVEDNRESRFLRVEARTALKVIQAMQPILSLRESLNAKKQSSMLTLGTPKGEYVSSSLTLTKLVKGSFLSPSGAATVANTIGNHKRPLSYHDNHDKCENIEDEEESVLVRKNVQSGVDKEKMRKMLQGEDILDESHTAQSKEEGLSKFKAGFMTQKDRPKRLEVKGVPPKLGVKGYFSQF